MTLSRDDILAAIGERSKVAETISIPEWGGDICVRRLTPTDMEKTGLGARRDASVFAAVIAVSLTDEEGAPLFTEKDVKKLAGADMAATARVFSECMRINGLLDESMKEAVATFTGAQTESSSSS